MKIGKGEGVEEGIKGGGSGSGGSIVASCASNEFVGIEDGVCPLDGEGDSNTGLFDSD